VSNRATKIASKKMKMTIPSLPQITKRRNKISRKQIKKILVSKIPTLSQLRSPKTQTRNKRKPLNLTSLRLKRRRKKMLIQLMLTKRRKQILKRIMKKRRNNSLNSASLAE